jgi:hypothetical protein
MTHNDEIESRRDSRWAARSIGRQTFTSPAIDWDACYVYVGWGHDRSRPLYVGKSREPLNRIGRHLRQTAWGASVVDWELYAFGSELEALDAESRAIHELDPIHNIARGGPGGMRTRQYRPRDNESRRRRMPTALEAISKPIHGISPEQLAIIRRVQNRRGRAA